MHRTSKLCAVILATVIAGAAMSQAQVSATKVHAENPSGHEAVQQPTHHDLSLLTIVKGDHGGWGHENSEFAGANLIIRGPDAWGAFWGAHTSEPIPPPPVDFEHQVVLVAVQGLQPTAGGPNVSIVGVHGDGPFVFVAIVDDHRPGPIDEISNPFHIVAAPKDAFPPHRAVVFQRMRPAPESGAVMGRVFGEHPDGDPMPLGEAHVVLMRPGDEPRHAMSGMDGSYFFVNVPPGEYVMRAEHSGFEPVEFPVFLPPDAALRHDIFLPPLPPPPPGAFWGVVMGVVDEGVFEPIPGALVRLMRPEGEVRHGFTDEFGVFMIDDVPPGPYIGIAEAEGWLPAETEIGVPPGQPAFHVFLLHRP